MYKKIITTLIILTLWVISASAKDNEKKKKAPENIVIFNLKSNNKSKKYNYYSTIIPHTISKSLKKSREFIVIRNYQKIDKVKNHKSRREVQNFIQNTKNYGLENKDYDYILVGDCNIIEESKDKKKKARLKEISITIQIIDVRNKKAINFTEKSKEVGAIFHKTVDLLSTKINTSLIALKKKSTSTAMMKFHKVMSKVNIGMKGGRAFLVGEFEDTFDDTVLIGPYVLIHPIKWFGISINFDYFSSKAKKDTIDANKSLIIYDSYMAFHGIIPIKMFDITLSGGLGVTYTRIHIDDPLTPMNPFSYSNSNKERTDYSVNIELSINFNISIIRMSIGASYKSIFYEDDQMQVLSAIIGLGFRF